MLQPPFRFLPHFSAQQGIINDVTQTKPALAPDATGRLVIDLDAIASNIEVLRQAAPNSQMMAIVKADAYGHGMLHTVDVALKQGISWFGVAHVNEALTVRSHVATAGYSSDQVRIFTWLMPTDQPWDAVIDADIDVSVSWLWALEQACEAAQRTGKKARVHLKIDTGMSRGGAPLEELPDLAHAAAKAQANGLIDIIGAWSHLSRADDDTPAGNDSTAQHLQIFTRGLQILDDAGITPQLRHLAATAGTLWHPDTHFDMVRPGIGLYGLSPDPKRATSADLGLRPALQLHAQLGAVKRIEAGTPVSYGGTWTAPTDRWLGLVPIGYAEGLPRLASNRTNVCVTTRDGRVIDAPIVGRICMDQFMVDLGTAEGKDAPAQPGDLVILMGTQDGEPTADTWAAAADTINYEIVTCLGGRLQRQWAGKE